MDENKAEVNEIFLSLDGIVMEEESQSGQCLTLDGIVMDEDESPPKNDDGNEFQLDLTDPTEGKISHSDTKNIPEQNFNSEIKQSNDANVADGCDDSRKTISAPDEFFAIENSGDKSINISDTKGIDSERKDESESKDIVEVNEKEQKEESKSNENAESNKNMTTEENSVSKNKETEIEEENVSLENILRKKSKMEPSDSESDSEFDFDLPVKSNGMPQIHNKTAGSSAPKTVVSVSDIDFAFSASIADSSSAEKSEKTEENKIETLANQSKESFHLENSANKETSKATKEIDLASVKNTEKLITGVPATVSASTKVAETQRQGQTSVDMVSSPKKKRAPDIPHPTQDKSEDGKDDKQQGLVVNGEAVTESDTPLSFTTNTALQQAMDEWESVQTIEAGYSQSGTQGTVPKIVQAMPLLTFKEFHEYFRKCDFTSVKSNIQTHIDRHGFAALKNFLFGPPKLHRDLIGDREQIFCVAASMLDNSENVHLRSLQTIYRTLTGSRFDCGRYGSHWEEIGFQGNDPSTDLRGTGLLGLANLIHFLVDPRRKPLAQDIYKLSLHPTQNFPFCVMGINMSRITLQSLREDCLNKECNKRKDVFSVINDFYVGLYLQLYQVWKSQGKTIADSGHVIKHVESEAKKSPHQVFKNLEDYLNKKKTGKSTSAVNLENMDVGTDNFLGVCETDAGQY